MRTIDDYRQTALALLNSPSIFSHHQSRGQAAKNSGPGRMVDTVRHIVKPIGQAVSTILVRPSIGQPLAFDAFERKCRALCIFDADAGTVGITERKLSLNVLLVAMNECPAHPALKLQEKVFNVVGSISCLIDVFRMMVIDRLMIGKLAA